MRVCSSFGAGAVMASMLAILTAGPAAQAAVTHVDVHLTPDASMLTTDAVFTNRVVWRSPLLDVRPQVQDVPADVVLADGDVFELRMTFTQPWVVLLMDAGFNSLEGIKFEVFGTTPAPDVSASVDYVWLFEDVVGGPLATSNGATVMTSPITGSFSTLGLATRIVNRNIDLVSGGDTPGAATFGGILLTLTYDGPGAWTFDQARLTIASEQVAIIPEPGGAAVLLTVAIGLLLRRGHR